MSHPPDLHLVARAFRRWHRELRALGASATRRLLEAASPRAGESVLDLGSGAGEPALDLAARVGPGGRVVATDAVGVLLDVLRDRAREEGLENVVVRTCDMGELPFDDESFDVVTARFSLMLAPDPLRALTEAVRVLRPGGRAVWIVWADGPNATFEGSVGVLAHHVAVPDLRRDDRPGPFRFARAGALAALAAEAGFVDIVESRVVEDWVWPGAPADAWICHRDLLAPLVDGLLAGAPAEVAERAREEMRSAFMARSLRHAFHVVSARRPVR